jgi:hypothetical protein
MFAVGATDKLQGTGVWSFIKAERDSGANKAANKTKRPEQKKKTPQRFPGGK